MLRKPVFVLIATFPAFFAFFKSPYTKSGLKRIDLKFSKS